MHDITIPSNCRTSRSDVRRDDFVDESGASASIHGAVRKVRALYENFEHPFRLVVGDISVIAGKMDMRGDNNTLCEIVFLDAGSFIRFSKSLRLLTLANLFIEGRVTYRGEAFEVAEIIDKLRDRPETTIERIESAFTSVLYVLKYARAKLATSTHHYSIDTVVYELFLDTHMQYTCARFEDEHDDLETAQVNKLELIARWLDLQRGGRHLDIGCGWGGAVAYFSKVYGVECSGISDSEVQSRYTKAILAKQSIKNCFIYTGDFSDHSNLGCFDTISVVGMLEHVKRTRYSELFKYVYKSLKPGGRAYIQCITKSSRWIGGDGSRFLQKYVFPGYHIDKVDVILNEIARTGLRVESCVDHARDYSLTTKCWLTNFQKNRNHILQRISQKDYNIFIAYLTMASKVFGDGRGALHRIRISKPV